MIQMVDLHSQHQKIRTEIDAAIKSVIDSGRYIGGAEVDGFAKELGEYLGVNHVIPCANGTDALQIALMAVGLKPGDEVIVPAFTYVATAEVIGLLRLKPVMIDVDPNTFNIDVNQIEKAITKKTKAIVPVHLFGQSADMFSIMEIAEKHKLFVIEDNAQAIGATYTFPDKTTAKTGTIGHIGCTSFFPSKNLGCMGDGGAMFTNDAELAGKIKMIANHGQSRMYYHDVLGVNSRLDAIQAAILRIKLRNLDKYNSSRQHFASLYDGLFSKNQNVEVPARAAFSDHVFHQYTLKVKNSRRDDLKKHLESNGVSAMIYYPVPLQKQLAFKKYHRPGSQFPVADKLCEQVISLPMHSEPDVEIIEKIGKTLNAFFGV